MQYFLFIYLFIFVKKKLKGKDGNHPVCLNLSVRISQPFNSIFLLQ
jgi:hypothetical protein